MPDVPWFTPHRPDPEAELYVMASRFETRTLTGALRFLLGTPGILRQLRSAPGAHGAALRARPFRRTFLTLSVWESRDALHRFAGSGTHRATARRLAPLMRASAFTHWSAPADALPLSWGEATRQLDEAE
ncbi:DUF3291 domain-containing protein [Streptomyces sp. NPDC060194]|uniref:DUF3291 domain-containing protein n=1 Tax=Streptomyces sp. NPDC060194 TaxID=3347069 RepID=UPI00366A1ACC